MLLYITLFCLIDYSAVLHRENGVEYQAYSVSRITVYWYTYVISEASALYNPFGSHIIIMAHGRSYATERLLANWQDLLCHNSHIWKMSRDIVTSSLSYSIMASFKRLS
jgi:hypothetical protein